MNRTWMTLILVMLATGCPNKNSNLNASDCGEQGCPIGTTPEEYRKDREGFEVQAGADPATYSGEVAFKTFGESECAYQCVAIFTCAEDQYPFITESCYACAGINPDGEIIQPDCDTARSAEIDDTGISF